MEEAIIKTNSLKAWLLAARPKTLSGAAVPVMIGAALAWQDAKMYDGDVLRCCVCSSPSRCRSTRT